MQFNLRTAMLVQTIILVIIGWVVDRHIQQNRSQLARTALENDNKSLRTEIIVRELTANLCADVFAARAATSAGEYEAICRSANGTMEQLRTYGSLLRVAKSTLVEAARIKDWPDSEYRFGLLAPNCLGELGSSELPFVLKLLESDEEPVRRLGAQTLLYLVHPVWRDQVSQQLSPDEAQPIIDPVRRAIATERKESIRLVLEGVLESVEAKVNGEEGVGAQ